MSAVRFLVIFALAVFFFTQIAVSRPDNGLKSVDAEMSVHFDEMKKSIEDIYKNVTTAFQSAQSEFAKQASPAFSLQNLNDTLTGLHDKIMEYIASSATTAKP